MPEEPPAPSARLHGPKRLLLLGPVASFVVAIGSGALGADGRAGFFLFLLLLSVTFGVTGLWIGGQLLVDEFRGEATSRKRGLLTLGMFVATLVCMTAAGGVAAGGGSGS